MATVNSELCDMQEPTDWVETPNVFSFTSLESISRCPRRWQFLRSAWGPHRRFPVPPSVAALEGRVIHRALEKLARALGARGRPQIGTAEFQSAMGDCDFWGIFSALLVEMNEGDLRSMGRNVISRPPRELANRAIRLFRASYVPGNGVPWRPARGGRMEDQTKWKALLHSRGSVAEAELTHPQLPFMGIIDLVVMARDGRSTILDYKTGKHADSDQQQVLLYALLWWRATGDLPAATTIQYLDGCLTAAVDATKLEEVEELLARRLRHARGCLGQHPAPSQPSTACRYCPVRARCDEGWAAAGYAADRHHLDLEMTVQSEIHATGFMAKKSDGTILSVVLDSSLAGHLPTGLAIGNRIRLISASSARPRGEKNEIEIRPSTEILRLPR